MNRPDPPSHPVSGLGLSAQALAAWPGAERREPRVDDRHYLVLSSLAESLRVAVDTRLGDRAGLDVLDVGCGTKPYLPFFAERAGSYRGIDLQPGPLVDDVGGAEELPYPEGAFDVVLCTQVLEHLKHPERAVGEFNRVLRPGGAVFASTHGVFLYHPDPPGSDQDYWRWTHAGLERLFREAAPWTSIDVVPNGDVVACLGYIACQFLGEAGDRLPVPWLGRALLSGANRFIRRLDRRFPPRARVPHGGSMSANYLLSATKP